MTDDSPAAAPRQRQTTQATTLTVSCMARCGRTDKVPAFEDRTEKNPERKIKTVALAPWICLTCWRNGWRAEGPQTQDNAFRLYNLDGVELPR